MIKPNGYALKLRLDDPSSPRAIELLDERPDGASYSFERKNVNQPPISEVRR